MSHLAKPLDKFTKQRIRIRYSWSSLTGRKLAYLIPHTGNNFQVIAQPYSIHDDQAHPNSVTFYDWSKSPLAI